MAKKFADNDIDDDQRHWYCPAAAEVRSQDSSRTERKTGVRIEQVKNQINEARLAM